MRILLLVLLLLPLPSLAQSPRQLYNEACAKALADQQDQALQKLKAAAQAGFDDFRFAARDPDLATVVASPAFQELVMVHDSRMTLLSAEKGLDLEENSWTPWQNLGEEARFRLRWERNDLVYEVLLRGEAARGLRGPAQPPWVGGPGLFLTVAVPDGSSAFESANTFHVALGRHKNAGAGALYGGHVLGWQPVQELAPILDQPGDGWDVRLKGKITWQTIRPFHPLVDPVLGFNLSVRAVNRGPVISWLTDPAAFSTVRAHHRFVPLRFTAGSPVGEALLGRTGHSLVEGGTLPLDVVILAQEAGSGVLKMDFLDAQQRSVLASGPVPTRVDFRKGRNVLTRQADFSALDRGPYLLKVDVEMPSGQALTWSSLVLNLGAGWRADCEERIASLPALQQTTGQYYLETVAEAARNLPQRRHPGSLTTTLLELETFLGAAAVHGSILPESGIFRAAWPSPQGPEPVLLFLPAGYRQAAGLRPVVISADTPGIEVRMADRMQRFYRFGELPNATVPAERQDFPVFVLTAATAGSPLASRTTNLEQLLDWTRRFFAADGVLVAGMNSGADSLLDLVSRGHLRAEGGLVLAGSRLAPWPGEQEAALRARFQAGADQAPPLRWLDFYQETELGGQARTLFSALRQGGYNLGDVEKIKGGLSLTQAADRVVLWAEEAP
ncbi:hypothetical protein CSB20_05370 [bacterium DOLZORAL124_64_63]|nr:MAG: hypothetical protein CSB20_05370 [bacterium DOLZORAL124_64_63]